MAQLVGTNCAVCQARITNELDARFCRACGHPRHDGCARPPAYPTDTLCRACGAAVDPADTSSQPKVPPRPAAVAKPQGPFPVAKVCPECGSEKYKKAKPVAWVAFVWDRVCKDCSTRYTPPTPPWAALVFLLAGFLLAGGGLLGALFSVVAGDVLGLVCVGAAGIMGCLAIFHGLRSLLTSDDVREPPTGQL